MLEIFRTIEQTKEPLIVTDRGRPVLEIKAIQMASSTETVLASLRTGKILTEVNGDEAMVPLHPEDWQISGFPED